MDKQAEPIQSVTAPKAAQGYVPPEALAGSTPAQAPRPRPVSAPGGRTDRVEISTQALEAAKSQVIKLRPAQASKGSGEAKGPGGHVNFDYNQDLGILTKQIVDRVTGKVEKQFPPEAVVALREQLHKVLGEFIQNNGGAKPEPLDRESGKAREIQDLLGSGEGDADGEASGEAA